MLWKTFEEDKESLLNQYAINCWNMKSGLPVDELKAKCIEIARAMDNEPRIKTKATLIELILQNAQIEVSPINWFEDKLNHGDIMPYIRDIWQKKIDETYMKAMRDKNLPASECYCYTADVDYGHTIPDWDNVLTLGIPGLLNRVKSMRRSSSLTNEQIMFYDSCEKVYTAIICYIDRLANETKKFAKNNEKMLIVSQTLKNLTEKPPKTLQEAMQLTFIYYFVQQHLDSENVRSLGGLDRLYYKFYKSDIENKVYNEEQIRELVRYFFCKMSAKKVVANVPFFLGGLDENENYSVNDLTYILLDEYINLGLYDPKIHIRYHENMPDRIIKTVSDSIRKGTNSFVFMNDNIVVKALMNIGESKKDALNYAPVGCYEPASVGKELPCTCNGSINIPKAIETAMYNGIDPITKELIGVSCGDSFSSFDEFYEAVKKQLVFFANRTREQISHYETYYMEVNPSPVLSATMDECITQGKDAYAGGAKYNNSSINAFGIATAIDSLIAIKKAVFDNKIVSFEQMRTALSCNWNGFEQLRMTCINYPKYGNGNVEVDEMTKSLCDFIADQINNYPNGRGGVFRFGMFSIDWNFTFGEHTGATPDGRFAHEMLSKNMTASTGMDRNGVTALINSVSKIDYTKIPNGTVLDLTLHTSATNGENGLLSMIGLIKTYMKLGAMAIHINVLDANILKKAQMKPEDYPTLQIRVCGWNAYFVNLSKKEQDDFIRKAENNNE